MSGIPASEIRGFNYQPSYSPHLIYNWTAFDAGIWERDVSYACRFGANMLRVWLDWSAYSILGSRMWDNLDTALSIVNANGMSTMPVLYNRWWDAKYPSGGISDNDLRMSCYNFNKFAGYVDSLMERFGSDTRISYWDLCNEPQAPYYPVTEVSQLEMSLLSWTADRVRRLSDIPITIGSMTYDYVRVYAPLVDTISFHPYPGTAGEMEKLCVDHLEIASEFGKPLICSETCKGSFDDKERGLLTMACIETLEAYGIGWLAWQLTSGRFVSGNRERTDDNAVRPGEGYMPFILEDGTTRPYHEWLERTDK